MNVKFYAIDTLISFIKTYLKFDFTEFCDDIVKSVA